MNPFHRLHALRMENDAAGFAMDEMRPRFQRIAARHENGTAPRAVAAFQLFQTPADLAARMVGMLTVKPERVLEPSAGLGRILDALQVITPFEVVAVEVTSACAGELYRQDRAGVILKQCDFLTLKPDSIGTFDAIVMNPPFHMRADIRHIKHALQFLRPGGELVALCLSGYKREQELKPLACEWHTLPAGTFRESGTDVSTCLLRVANI